MQKLKRVLVFKQDIQVRVQKVLQVMEALGYLRVNHIVKEMVQAMGDLVEMVQAAGDRLEVVDQMAREMARVVDLWDMVDLQVASLAAEDPLVDFPVAEDLLGMVAFHMVFRVLLVNLLVVVAVVFLVALLEMGRRELMDLCQPGLEV